MVLIFALIAASVTPVAICRADRVCLAANAMRGRYAAWTEVVNQSKPGTFDVYLDYA